MTRAARISARAVTVASVLAWSLIAPIVFTAPSVAAAGTALVLTAAAVSASVADLRRKEEPW